MPWSEEDKARMEEAGRKAGADFDVMFKDLTVEQQEAFRKLAKWWKKWVGTAGHKNLYRALMERFGA